MLNITKKTDYALIALAYMAERPGRPVSAREIAETGDLPRALMQNILKHLHHHHLLTSVRGVQGGYQLAARTPAMSLCELIGVMECNGKSDDCGCGCSSHAEDEKSAIVERSVRGELLHAPVQALQYKLTRFLKEIAVADLILPGRRIDVPLERVGRDHSSVTKSRLVVSV